MCERLASLSINNVQPTDHNLFVSTVLCLLSIFLCYIILGDLRRIRVQRYGEELRTRKRSDGREGEEGLQIVKILLLAHGF